MFRPSCMLAAALLIPLAGCGASAPTRDAQAGSTIAVDGLDYQVQTSRLLNPDSAADRPLFTGIPARRRDLPGDQVWAGVFLQVHNPSGPAREAARKIVLADAFDHVFRPARLARDNAWAYRPAVVAHGASLPSADSPVAYPPDDGSVLIFRMPLRDYRSTPLELRVTGAAQPHALGSIQLDT